MQALDRQNEDSSRSKQAVFEFAPIGYVHSPLQERSEAPRQGYEGAPTARLEILRGYVEGLKGIIPGQEIWIFTWLHRSERSTLEVHLRGDVTSSKAGVFATRSPDRPNPIGLHRAKVLSIDDGGWIQVQSLEAIDGTPILDIKPVLELERDLG